MREETGFCINCGEGLTLGSDCRCTRKRNYPGEIPRCIRCSRIMSFPGEECECPQKRESKASRPLNLYLSIRDRSYLAYLTMWATDQILTTLLNHQADGDFHYKEKTYPEIREEAELLFQNFEVPE